LLSKGEIAPYTDEIRRLMGDTNAAGFGSYGWVPYGFPNDPTKGVIYGVYHSNGSYFAEWRYYEGAQLKDVGRSKPFGAPVDALQELEEVTFIQPLRKYGHP
jgi:hypothetical protein